MSLTKPVAKKPKRDEGVAGSGREHAHDAMPHEWHVKAPQEQQFQQAGYIRSH